LIAVDTSALVAVALGEPERADFNLCIARHGALIGTPTLLELSLVLTTRLHGGADAFLDGLLRLPGIHPVDFSLDLSRAASEACLRFGRGRHPAGLNFGDCMAYAVARVHDVPLLFKGDDFARTDIRPAFR